MPTKNRSSGWFYSFLLGGVLGIGLCAAVAVYLTNTPIPFVNKVDQASQAVNPIADGTIPDPNKPLSKQMGTPADAPQSQVASVEAPTPEQSQAEARLQEEQGSRFVVQAGAFRSKTDADNLRARLAFQGLEAKIIPRTEDGITLHRVRLGPYGTLDEANRVKKTLQESSISALVGRIK